MAGYIGTQAVSVNTTSATISDDLAVGDDLTVTDDATIGGTALVTGVLTTTAATVFNGGFASNGDSTMGTDKKLIFRDSAIHISSTADGDLSIAADDEIDITSTLIDVNGNLDVSGRVGVSTATEFDGTALTAALTVSGGSTSGAILQGFRTANSLFILSMSTAGRSYFATTGAQSQIHLQTGTTVGSATTKMTIEANGDALINDGNLVIGTAGHGIDFSATGNISGTSSELLDDYERGSFTVGYSGATIGGGGNTGHYIKVGAMVFWTFYSEASNISSASGNAAITGLPFTVYNDVSAYSPINIAHNTYFGGSATVGTQGYHGPNGTTMVFNNPGVTTSSTYVNGNSKYLMVSGTYVTDA